MSKAYTVGSDPQPIAVSRAVIYGSLYMDRGERWDKVESQLVAFDRRRREGLVIVGFTFDIICLQRQRAKANKFAERLRRDAAARYSLTSDVSVSVLTASYRGDDPCRRPS